MKKEVRAILAKLEVRAAAADTTGPMAAGYVVNFNSETVVGEMWREKFMPGAFKRTLTVNDVIAVHSHDTGRVVGRLQAGTLTLREDEKGLAFENSLPDTTDGRDLVVQIERQDIAGMSFGFVATRQEWNESVEPPLRTIYEADLYEITYSACPQYTDTEVGLRSLEHARTERRDHNKTAASARIGARRARQAQLDRNIR